MKKLSALALLVLPLVFAFVVLNLAIANAQTGWSYSAANDKQGITGTVTIGPTSPVCVDTCYALYSTTMEVLNDNGRVITTFTSGSNGQFSLALNPGTYTVRPINERLAMHPYASPQTVVVPHKIYAQMVFLFDSGIR